MTSRLGRDPPANGCPPGKNCPRGDRVGVVGVGKAAHLASELLISIPTHIIVVEQVSNRTRQVPAAASTPVGNAGDIHLSVGDESRDGDLAQCLAQTRLRTDPSGDWLSLQG